MRLEGERRLATVILADVCESTHLMEQIGTEAWVSMMNRVFHILESEIYRYGGTVDQFRGDGLVAFFGTVVAHEDDPERAVMASLAMQRAISDYAAELADQQGIELGLRVGVNTGEVIVASIGDRTQHSEDTAMGEAIALAARMEQAAEPGTVLVSENTFDLISSRFDWEPLGEITVKGIRQPVTIYRPIAPRTDVVRSLQLEDYGLSPQLIGRDREYESIKQRTDDLRDGLGSIVLLSGDEGMGKSYLVSKVRQQVLRDDALLAEANAEGQPVRAIAWLCGQARSYEQSWPYSMWLDLLRRWLGAHGEPREEMRDRLRSQSEALWQERADQYYPYLATLLSLPLEDRHTEWVNGLDAESLRQQIFVTLQSWIETMAQRGPVALVFDDVYWSGATSLELLEYCLPLCDHKPVLFLIMCRLNRSSAIWEFHHRIETQYPHRLLTLTLGPLTKVQVSEMIDRLIGAEGLPREVRTQIVEKAEGNPYYVGEIIRSLIRDDALALDMETGKWRLTRDVHMLELPDTLRGLLLERIDDLAPEERHVLQMAAIIGTVFWENVLRDLVGPEYALEQHMTALQRAQLIEQRGRVPDLGMEYVFRSALIRDLASDSILSAQRVICCRQVADSLAQLFGEEVLAQYYDVVAHQYRCAGEHRKELFYTLSAAEYAQGVYANAEALEHYTRALELLDELEEERDGQGLWQDWRLESLKSMGKILFGIGQVDEAEPYLRKAARLAEEEALPGGELVRLYYWLCEVLFWQNRYVEQIELAEKGLTLLGDDRRSVEAALMNQEIAVGYRASGHTDKFLEYSEQTAEFLEDLPYSEELRPAYDHLASMYAFDKKDIGEAMRWLGILEKQATLYHDVRAMGRVHDYAGLFLQFTGDLDEALARTQQALESCERTGDAIHVLDVVNRLADVLLDRGELEEAMQYVEQALELATARGGKSDVAWAQWRRGRAFAAREAWAEALCSYDTSVQLFRDAGDESRRVVVPLFYSGRAHLLQADRAAASSLFRAMATLVEPADLEQDSLVLAAVLCAVESALEDMDEFRAFCQQWHAQIPDTLLVQWYLKPDHVERSGDALVCDDRFQSSLAPDWTWQDPLDDCMLRVREGLQIRAANGRDLRNVNYSAPRLLRPISGIWAMETVCRPVSSQEPAIGGLLVWKDKQNYLRLDRGLHGRRAILFAGCLGNQDVVIGRGLVPLEAGDERMYLRLECTGNRVKALCSADGTAWFGVGEVSLGVKDPIQVGLYANGSVDRTVYPGSHRDGSAIQFESFRLWAPSTA